MDSCSHLLMAARLHGSLLIEQRDKEALPKAPFSCVRRITDRILVSGLTEPPRAVELLGQGRLCRDLPHPSS